MLMELLEFGDGQEVGAGPKVLVLGLMQILFVLANLQKYLKSLLTTLVTLQTVEY